MKKIIVLITIATSAFLLGCAGERPVALAPVGPPPAMPAPMSGGVGSLIVYSARESAADFNARDSRRPEYSDYAILNATGGQLRRVRNNSGAIFQEPATVPLAPGNYQVVARANGYGLVTVPVVIQSGKITTMRLDRSSREIGLDESQAVRLPNGEIVGWKSVAN